MRHRLRMMSLQVSSVLAIPLKASHRLVTSCRPWFVSAPTDATSPIRPGPFGLSKHSMIHQGIAVAHLCSQSHAVYQLEEMWDLIRSLPSEAVSSLVDQTRKRLSHKSPIVKQKVRTADTLDLLMLKRHSECKAVTRTALCRRCALSSSSAARGARSSKGPLPSRPVRSGGHSLS